MEEDLRLGCQRAEVERKETVQEAVEGWEEEVEAAAKADAVAT